MLLDISFAPHLAGRDWLLWNRTDHGKSTLSLKGQHCILTGFADKPDPRGM
jgi:hypothetical protein